MKSYREELWFTTETRRAYINITDQVVAAVRTSGVREEQIFYAEFDGRRRKRALIKIIGE